MITALSIKNYALIEKLSISFSSGFSTITGETGAGKSIILGALGLVLGKRADLTSLKNKEEKCVIEAQFSIEKYQLKAFFEANDLDYEADTILRREILPSGKSRAFVNDSPVNLQELQELGTFLLDIHSQQQTRELSEETIQFEIIDAIAKNATYLIDYKTILKHFKADKARWNVLQKKQQEVIKEQEYTSYLCNELQEAKLKAGEQIVLEQEFEQLNNVEIIKEALGKSLSVSQAETIGIVSQLQEVKVSLQKIAPLSANYQTLFERTTSLIIELDDINSDLLRSLEKLINDPEQLEIINQKLQRIYSLQKKHQVSSVEELLEIQNTLEKTLLDNGALGEEIAVLEKKNAENEKKLNEIAEKIHSNRQKNIPVLLEKITEILSQLGMPNARFSVALVKKEHFFENGTDEIQFLLSANKGTDFGLLKKVASGGEMSRIMLAVKAILAEYSKLPTLIFDEIDTGVSGEIAIKMGEIMKKMSATMQIFAITHLPQIAAKGNAHFKVSKTTIGEETQSELHLLNAQERIQEIAQMLSGNTVSESALNHAKELLN